MRALEQQLRAAEQREHDTQRHHQLQLQEKDCALVTQLVMKNRELTDANRRHGDAEERAQLAEQKEQVTQNRCEELLQEKYQIIAIKEQESYDANHRHADAERRVQDLSAEIGRSDRRAQLAEERAEGLETQWVVHREEITMTERQLGGGGWGVVKVAKF